MRSVGAVAMIAGLLFAQAKPDFSGTWKQENAKCDFAKLPAPMSVTDTIVHHEPSLHLTQTVVGQQGDSVTSDHDYATDGREQTGKSRNYTEKTSVKWDGNALLFENRRDYSGREVIIRERWTLSEDGRILTKERTSLVSKGEVKQTFVLEKQ